VSCIAWSNPAFARTTPVTPPTVNKKINPKQNSIGVLYVTLLPINVANQLKILTPVGTAIIIVAAVKYPRVSTSIPTVNMWCAQTIKPSVPIPSMAYTIPIYPKTCLLTDAEIT